MEAKPRVKPAAKPAPYKHDVSVCLGKIVKRVKKFDPSVTDIEFELSTIQKFGVKPQRFKTGQPLKIYRATKRGNSKAKTSYVPHDYCPFCGKKRKRKRGY